MHEHKCESRMDDCGRSISRGCARDSFTVPREISILVMQ